MGSLSELGFKWKPRKIEKRMRSSYSEFQGWPRRVWFCGRRYGGEFHEYIPGKQANTEQQWCAISQANHTSKGQCPPCSTVGDLASAREFTICPRDTWLNADRGLQKTEQSDMLRTLMCRHGEDQLIGEFWSASLPLSQDTKGRLEDIHCSSSPSKKLGKI